MVEIHLSECTSRLPYEWVAAIAAK